VRQGRAGCSTPLGSGFLCVYVPSVSRPIAAQSSLHTGLWSCMPLACEGQHHGRRRQLGIVQILGHESSHGRVGVFDLPRVTTSEPVLALVDGFQDVTDSMLLQLRGH